MVNPHKGERLRRPPGRPDGAGTRLGVLAADAARGAGPWIPENRGFAALLAENAARGGNEVAFRFLARGIADHVDMTWAELLQAASRRAGALQDFRERQIGLLCNRPQDFVVSLAAIFLAGAIAVPMPATLNRRSSEHVRAIIAAADLAAIVAPAGVLGADWLADGVADNVRRLPLEKIGNLGSPPLPATGANFAAPGILQFTSGSTGQPRGIALSQSNLITNCQAIVGAYGLGRKDIGLSWLPLHHDMGLVGHVLVPILLGGRSVIMDPLRFLQKPLSWLEAIGRERATITSAPNFAYELCNLAAPGAVDLDLASLSTAICGGEPVLAETLDNFVENFARFGFKRAALAPSYGLAEATLLVSTGKIVDGPAKR
jgi:acyl-CoA synthetase (AMP-forming)/AMP-acid ligase II